MAKIQSFQPVETIGVIYARFSSHNQREESIEQQIAECRAYAAANNIKIVEVFADSAKTGRSDRRPQFQRLQREAKKGKFAVIIAYKSNRIARNMLNAMMFENEMDKLGIKVLYAKEEFGNNAAGRFALRTMMNVNQFFSENMGEDIKRNQADNALNCRANGPASFGYKTGDDGRFVIDEPAAEIVREIFTRVACGEPFVDIANDLNARGIKTRKGNPWGKSSFVKILKNERYIGVYIFNDVRIEGGMPEIISKELFYKVQNIIKNKKNPQGRHRENGDYLLTGKLFCGECESHMIGMSGTSKNGTLHYYYVCNNKRLGGTCKKTNAKRDYVEYEIARAIRQYILRDDIMEWIADLVESYQKAHKNNPERLMLEDQLVDIKKSIANMLIAIEQGIITASTKERLLQLEKEQSEISSKIALLNSQNFDITRTQVISWLETFQDGLLEDKKYQSKLFNTFLRKAYLYDDGHAKLILELFGDQSKSVDIDLSTPNSDEPVGECSYKLSYGSPKEKNPNYVRIFLFFCLHKAGNRRKR